MAHKSYRRVIPRDLFNEAKLLKCLGQLALIAHDGKDACGKLIYPIKVELDTDAWYPGFDVDQNPDDGSLFVDNLKFSCGGKKIVLRCPYNSRQPYPLLFHVGDDAGTKVFDDFGTLTKEFHDHLISLSFDARMR